MRSLAAIGGSATANSFYVPVAKLLGRRNAQEFAFAGLDNYFPALHCLHLVLVRRDGFTIYTHAERIPDVW